MKLDCVPDATRYQARDRSNIVFVVVHRISARVEDPSYGDTPKDIVRFFHEHPIGIDASGGKMPYSLLIEDSGAVTQMVPLGRVTPHARTYNPTAVGIACIGDFRAQKPSPQQERALVDACVEVLAACGLAVTALVGHDELKGASRDPNKECPGRHLHMASLRDTVAEALARRPARPTPLVW